MQVGPDSVDLTPSEFELLETFMLSPGRAFSRLDLLESVSGDPYEGYERTIDVHIRNLRTKIERDPGKPPLHSDRLRPGLPLRPERTTEPCFGPWQSG